MNGNNSNTSTMAGGRNAAATPATTSATANLPVGGFVELEIVDTMWKAMQESKDPEDIELAAWMKTNYLNGYQGGVCLKAIGTMVGFQRLDRAYKRVRMLTGRTQEQWPFVDRRFKKLAAAAFRKNYVPEVEEDSAGSSAPSSTQPAASDIAEMVNRAPSSSASDSAIDVADSSDAGHINQPIAAAADASVVATMESEAGADSGRASRNSARHRNDDHFIEPALVETNLDNTPSKLSIKKKPGRKRNSSGIFVKKDMPEPKKARVSAASKATRGGRRGRTRLSNAKISDSSEEARSADPTAPIEEENGVGTPEATTVTGTNTPGIESTRLSTETSEYVPNKASTRGTTEDTGDVSMVDASDFDGGARDEQTEAPGSARESSFVRQPDMDKATVHAAAMEFVQQGLAEAAKTRTPSPAAQEDHVVHASTPEPKPVQPIEPVQAAVQASVAADTSSGASVPQPATAATLATSTSSGASVTQPAVTLATGTVEFLVRVHTSTGQVELPVPEVFLSDNIKLASRAHKYVEYKRGKEAKGAVAVSFEQWNEIVDGIDM